MHRYRFLFSPTTSCLGFTLQPFLGAQSMLLVAAYGKSY